MPATIIGMVAPKIIVTGTIVHDKESWRAAEPHPDGREQNSHHRTKSQDLGPQYDPALTGC
jgi:hypothetical protein